MHALAYSKYCYVEALESARQEDFIAGMVRAFAFFGGVPKLVKFDNMRVAVTKPDRYSPDFTLLVQQLADAILDRVTANSIRIELKGNSQRQHY